MAGVVRRSLEPGMDRHGAFREAGGYAVAPARHLADRAGLRARLCRFPFCRLRMAQGLSEARRLPRKDAGPALGKNLGAAARVNREGSCHGSQVQRRRSHYARYPELSAKFDVDQMQAATTRRNFLERYCDTDTLCCTAHFPSPSTGKIRRWGDGFSCEAVS